MLSASKCYIFDKQLRYKYKINQYKMQVSEKKINEWASLKEWGDVQKIGELLNISMLTASKLISTGKGSVEHLTKISDFYKERKKAIDSL